MRSYLIGVVLFFCPSIILYTAGAEGSDEWCDVNCSSFEKCAKQFQDDFVDLQLKIVLPDDRRHSEIGSNLIYGAYFGDTVARQTFKTQFVDDVSVAIGESACRIYMRNIAPLDDAVIVTFRLYPTLIHEISLLTQLAQNSRSALYRGKVTSSTDPVVGLAVHKWDLSLRLTCSINIIGGGKETNYLNEGSERWCEDSANIDSSYCEFELLFREDIARTLGLAHLEEVQVLFVKPAGKDSVLVFFRFIPYLVSDSAERIGNLVKILANQLADTKSSLYGGNVTVRVDSTWGISGKQKAARKASPHLPYNVLPTTIDKNERCKATQRCSRGWIYYDQHSGESSSTTQKFAGGTHVPIPLFANFEDWRQGTVGWQTSKRNIKMRNRVYPRGAHFSPMDFVSLGPSVPSYNTTSNNGLVLNHHLLEEQKNLQNVRINEIEREVSWLKENVDIAIMNADKRSRADVKAAMSNTLADQEALLEEQQSKMQNLSNSQCVHTLCELVFNTSSLNLSGAVNATGMLVTHENGTEVALWAFDSINLMADVNVTLVGQRAMALLSRSSVYIDTVLNAKPGTLGGFPGGFSVSRRSDNKLIGVCDPDLDSSNDGVTFKQYCAGDVLVSQLENSSIVSNNINGPGSGSVRVYLKTIEIVAPVQNEVQVMRTNADAGQTIAGGFKLHYNSYSTTFLRHDITASALKYNIENSLNGADINIITKVNRTDFCPGIGKVRVSREANVGSGGFTWTITFVSAIGNLNTITSTNLLSGKNANVTIKTIQEGNSIGGMYQLGFLGFWTRNLSHDVSSNDMEYAFIHDIPLLETASVVRTDAVNNCSDGFCTNGPTRAGGYVWTVTLTTQQGNISPGSPTSAEFGTEAPFSFMNATSKLLTGCIQHECPSLVVTDGHTRSNIVQMRNLISTKPFSFAYGGGGAGYGGKGGEGFGLNPAGKEYGDEKISRLNGGSGGALGYSQPFEANIFSLPSGRGGSGGGAIEIVAMNDIVLGPNGRLEFNGESGHGGMWTAGGGGSGGAVLLSADGVVKVDGKICVAGGNGGIALNPHGRSDIEDGHGGGGAGGRVAINAQSVVISRHDRSSHVNVVGGVCEKLHGHKERTRSCDGHNGTLYLDESLSSDIFVDTSVGGAARTSRSLYIKSKQQVNECEGSTQFGPFYDLGKATRPDRVSLFIRLDIDNESMKNYRQMSAKGAGLTFELLQENKKSNPGHKRATFGLYVSDKMKHGSNYLGDDDCVRHLKNMQSFLDETQYKRWYKIDIRLDWSSYVYDIFLDDVLAVRQAPFQGESIKSVNIGNSHPFIAAWVDEIYVGNDFTMGFRCPVAGPNGIESSVRPIQTGWKSSDVGGKSYNHPMQRHESHLSRRELYGEPDHGNLVPFDGEGHRAFHSDIKFRHSDGDHEEVVGDFNAGAITAIADHDNQKKYFIWYGEHENPDASVGETLLGAVGACSSEDLVTWKNEGLMLNYRNITDMVEGTSGPFHVERPKVLFNNITSKYVMWMTVDNNERELGMAGVAVSDFANGPFDFVRSFYPDGNETRDQTVFIDEASNAEGAAAPPAYLVRTYYATVEYVLPAAVMQPMWESVKNIDGSTNFGLSYHRANYEPGYDNFHDIYLQRWRKEDVPWKVVCVNHRTGHEREVPYGKEHLNYDGEMCHDATEYKKVLGQGSPISGPVKSRFLDPTDPANNVWVPNSVPGVKAQPWSANYKDGAYGVRELDDDIEILDADIDFDDLSSKRDIQYCSSDQSNLVDNPIHPTPPDVLIGQETVVTSRRAKFVAISELTEDYLDTTGRTHVFEGELEGSLDLGHLVWGLFKGDLSGENNKNFSWKTNDAILNGYSMTPEISRRGDFGFETANDWDTRFHQYEDNYNDRSEYSISCVIDGNCPANFRDQIASTV